MKNQIESTKWMVSNYHPFFIQ